MEGYTSTSSLDGNLNINIQCAIQLEKSGRVQSNTRKEAVDALTQTQPGKVSAVNHVKTTSASASHAGFSLDAVKEAGTTSDTGFKPHKAQRENTDTSDNTDYTYTTITTAHLHPGENALLKASNEDISTYKDTGGTHVIMVESNITGEILISAHSATGQQKIRHQGQLVNVLAVKDNQTRTITDNREIEYHTSYSIPDITYETQNTLVDTLQQGSPSENVEALEQFFTTDTTDNLGVPYSYT